MSNSHEKKLVQVRSSQFANVCLRLDGTGLTKVGPGGGKVNCQFGAGAWETFYMINNPNDTVSFESYGFPGVFLRMDGAGLSHLDTRGGGTVNGQFGAQTMEQFKLLMNSDETQSIVSTAGHFPPVALQMDGAGVVVSSIHGGGLVNCKTVSAGIGSLEKFAICGCTTHAQCHAAIDQFQEWFPQDATQIQAFREDIVCICCPPFSTKTPLSELESVPYGPLSKVMTEPEPTVKTTSCMSALFPIATDIISLALSLVGLGKMFKAMKMNKLYEAIGRKITNFEKSLWKIKDASTITELAKACFSFLGEIWNAGMFRIVWEYLKEEMNWWTWISTGVIAVAQFVAWFATEGIAFIAECVLILPSLVSLVSNAVTAVNVCFLQPSTA